MKSRLNLTVDPELVRKGKRIAARENKSLSELFETFLKKLPEAEEPLFMKMILEAKPSDYLNDSLDLKEEFAKGMREKYGL